MGTGINDALFSRTKQRVLDLLFGQPDRAYGVAELIRLAGVGSGSVQRELEKLTRAGLVEVVEPRRFRANRQASIFQELRGIIEKTSGAPGAVREALAPVAADIAFAAVYGSTAKTSTRRSSRR